ncbi:MAG: type II toxin-antitoxin system PemK/MazF family toxin [Epsilonproteobacteria bacterium]|nr:type II toxin-antitoxin system PemK/MazF family toxin [Campylobacterota bacterium]
MSNNDISILPLKVVVPFIGYKDIHKAKSWLVVVKPNVTNGLSKTSTADALNIRSISDERFLKKIGTIDEVTYLALVKAMRVVLDI